ncbi:hypothetical protein CYMTET_32741 [Cymbomonas tetramitiformis]|uniref:BAH domain-containing protein n=1 Tax=Cymbomonas tetramitiformis TaxID=36881 RepID=A0AAE0FEH7_9CHLO|nr:hypothetical protein CYMTET_32741 [Cymbomonas tetramitiformis]
MRLPPQTKWPVITWDVSVPDLNDEEGCKRIEISVGDFLLVRAEEWSVAEKWWCHLEGMRYTTRCVLILKIRYLETPETLKEQLHRSPQVAEQKLRALLTKEPLLRQLGSQQVNEHRSWDSTYDAQRELFFSSQTETIDRGSIVEKVTVYSRKGYIALFGDTVLETSKFFRRQVIRYEDGTFEMKNFSMRWNRTHALGATSGVEVERATMKIRKLARGLHHPTDGPPMYVRKVNGVHEPTKVVWRSIDLQEDTFGELFRRFKATKVTATYVSSSAPRSFADRDALNDILGEDWDLWCTPVEYAINDSRSAVTGFTPFELCYGHAPASQLDFFVEAALASRRGRAKGGRGDVVKKGTAHETARQFVQQLQTARDRLLVAQQQQVAQYDARHRARRCQSAEVMITRVFLYD